MHVLRFKCLHKHRHTRNIHGTYHDNFQQSKPFKLVCNVDENASNCSETISYVSSV